MVVAGGEGEVGKNVHGSPANLWVVEAGPEVVEGSGSTAEQWWRQGLAGSGELVLAWRGPAASLELGEEGTKLG